MTFSAFSKWRSSSIASLGLFSAAQLLDLHLQIGANCRVISSRRLEPCQPELRVIISSDYLENNARFDSDWLLPREDGGLRSRVPVVMAIIAVVIAGELVAGFSASWWDE